MRIEDHIAALRHEGHLLVAAVARADLDAVPATCPEWSVRELAHHMGRVHRWAATYVGGARPTMMSPEEDERCWGPMPSDANLVDWLRTGHADLVTALEQAPADLQCWSFLAAPSPRAFWARRQAHETSIHRVDAQGVLGSVDAVAPSFAADGIDELLLCFFSRPRNRLRLPEPRRLVVTATDAGLSWMVHIGPDGARAERGSGPADAEIAGPAAELYYALWNRRPLASLDLAGDKELVDVWQAKARILWT